MENMKHKYYAKIAMRKAEADSKCSHKDGTSCNATPCSRFDDTFIDMERCLPYTVSAKSTFLKTYAA